MGQEMIDNSRTAAVLRDLAAPRADLPPAVRAIMERYVHDAIWTLSSQEDYSLYETFKRHLEKMELSPRDYESAIIEFTRRTGL